jgi:peroxiredoxin/gas vesicle protein
MKRIIAAIGAALTVLALCSTTFGQRAEKTARPGREGNVAPVREPVGERQGAEQAQQAQKLRQQIEQMRADHQSLIDQLNALRATAAKEKAGQTVKQIDALISKRQAAFQEALRPLEQEQQQLQRAVRSRTGRPEQTSPRVRQAPEFELDSFDGRKVKLSDYKGQIVVLEWFNPSCPYSRYHYETAPTMVTLANKYRDRGVVWLAVNSTIQTTPEVNRAFTEKHKLPYPILDDRSGRLARRYGARTTPHIFIIDKDSRIAYDGAIDDAPAGQGQPGAGKVNYVDKALAELTLNHKVSLPNTPPYGSPIKYGRP